MKSPGIKDYFQILSRNIKLLLTVTISVSLISGIIVFFIIEPVFYSSSVLKSSIKGTNALSSILGGGLPDIGGLGDLGGGSSTKEFSLYQSILVSRRCLDKVIIKFKLNDEWEYKYFEDAVKYFRENVLAIKIDKTSGTMEIGVFDKSPQRAKQITEFLIEQLNSINTELNVQSAKNNREFIEKRYNEIQTDLTKYEDSLKTFQDKFGIAPDITVKAAAQSVVQIESEIKSEEIKLDILQKILSPDQSEITTQIEKINALKKQRDNIENSTDDSYSLRLKGAPDIVLNYLRLQRNVEIQNKILAYMVTLFEQAKVDEKRDMPSVQIIDEPVVPEKKAKPKRLIIILVSAFASFSLSSISIILYNTQLRSSKINKED